MSASGRARSAAAPLSVPEPVFGRATATRGAGAAAAGFCATAPCLTGVALAGRLTVGVVVREGGGGGVVTRVGGGGGGGGLLGAVVLVGTVVGCVAAVVVVVVVVAVAVVVVTTVGAMTIQGTLTVPHVWPFTLFRRPPISAVAPIATTAAPAIETRRCCVSHASAFLIGITSENSPEV